MAHTHLGRTIDIHGGGQDLVFPHHENEIAQSRCAHGTGRLARYWLHNGFLTMSGGKMAKSVGNIVLLRSALEQYHGETVRYALISGHYRKPLDWSEKLLLNAKSALDRLYLAVSKSPGGGEAEAPAEFADLLRNDLNTPAAIALLHEYATRLNKERDGKARRALRASLVAAGNLVGLLGCDPSEWFRFRARRHDADVDEGRIEALILDRAEAKRRRDYARADGIREDLRKCGVLLEDLPERTVWRWE